LGGRIEKNGGSSEKDFSFFQLGLKKSVFLHQKNWMAFA
jgi:hypothetical protein